MQSFRADTPKELKNIAKHIYKNYPDERIFLVNGELGVGKTAFTKQFVYLLGAKDEVTSPTFSIINEYYSARVGTIYHFDFYRINTINEIYGIGFEEFINSGCYCFIEWPELIIPILLQDYIMINIILLNNGSRNFSVKKHPNF